jgi:RNA polymerase-interacting CarD/CdnL/TRCF family regulator
VQALASSQASSNIRLIAAERNIQGIYDILQAIAREQSVRSQLIDQQIQALIDERRRS